MRNTLLILFAALFVCLISVFSGTAAAQSSPTPSAEKRSTTTAKKAVAKKKGPTVEAQLQQVTEQPRSSKIRSSSSRPQLEQLQQTNSQLQQQVQQQGQTLQHSVQDAAQQAVAAKQSVKALDTTVTGLQTETKAASNALLGNKKAVDALENPLAVHYKGLTVTPGWNRPSSFVDAMKTPTSPATSLPLPSTA